MAIYRLKRFSKTTDAMKNVAEEVYFEDLAPKTGKEALGAKIKRIAGNQGRKVAVEFRNASTPKKIKMVGLPVAGATLVGATAKTLHDKKKSNKEEKE